MEKYKVKINRKGRQGIQKIHRTTVKNREINRIEKSKEHNDTQGK